MALIRALSGSSGGGGATAIEGTYSGKTVTFSWDYDAVAYIIIFGWENKTTDKIAYGTIGSDDMVYADGVSYWPRSRTWSNMAITVVSQARAFSMTHVSNNFANAFIIPLTNTITI